jgi:hypothetical protein
MIWCGRAEGTIQVLCAPPGIRTRTCGLRVRDGAVRPVRHRALTCSFVHDALQLVVPCPPSCLVIAGEIVATTQEQRFTERHGVRVDLRAQQKAAQVQGKPTRSTSPPVPKRAAGTTVGGAVQGANRVAAEVAGPAGSGYPSSAARSTGTAKPPPKPATTKRPPAEPAAKTTTRGR